MAINHLRKPKHYKRNIRTECVHHSDVTSQPILNFFSISMSPCRFITKWCLLLSVAVVQSRTIKSKILTNENGTKELILDEGSDIPAGEIDFLIKDLNHMNITIQTTTEGTTTTTEESAEGQNQTELSESILLKHWNALTEVGWNGPYYRVPIRKMYLNNTRILQFGPVATTEVPAVVRDHTEVEDVTVNPKFGRKIWSNEVDDDEEEEDDEEVTTETTELPEKKEDGDVTPGTNKFIEGFHFVFQCTKEHSIQNGLLRCIASRIRSLIYPMWRKFDESIDYYLNMFETCPPNSTDTNTERAYYHRQRRFLYHIVLPLLVVVLVKYLVALPFLLLGMFAVKSLLFGLFSAGAASLQSIAKKYEYLYPRFPVKRYRQVQGVDLSPATSDTNMYWPQAPWSDDPRGVAAYENISM